MFSVKEIAKICHQANKAYCEVIGDNSQLNWENAPQWQQNSAILGVLFCKDNPTKDGSALHDAWVDAKIKAGWSYGPDKNSEKKEHPCIVPYEELPREQRLKDSLFKCIVSVLIWSE